MFTWLQVFTVDHEDSGRVRLDLDFAWDDNATPVPVTPDEEILCDVAAGYICARDACSVLWHDAVKWWPIGETHMLALQDGMLLEYDTATFAPTGVPLPPLPPAPAHCRDAVSGHPAPAAGSSLLHEGGR